MIQINNIAKHFGHETLFEKVSFSLLRGEKIGLVGRNGSGKSTLFRMILGELEPDEGEISFPKGYRIGTLPQHINFTKPTVLEEGCTALGPDEEYDHYKVERILFGLGFSEADMERDPSEFSGGFQIRINLTKALVQNPDLLLLDEPTNYLDIVSQRWLKETIASYPGEVILITHDRDFMDEATTHIMGLYRKKLKKIQGKTDDFYQRLTEEEEIHSKAVKNQERAKKHLEKYISRFRASARRASQAQSKMKQLAKFEDLGTLQTEATTLDFVFHHTPCPAKTIMTVDALSFSYPEAGPLIQQLSLTIGSQERIGIIGKNGRGKSTLLNLLADELTPTAGSVTTHTSLSLGHFGQTNINRLHDENTIEQEVSLANPLLTTEQVRAICGTMMFSQDKALKKIRLLSGGERSRVLLGKILAHETNLLMLDEPTNHLDQESVEALMNGIDQFPGAVVLVTHNERMLRELVDKIVVFHRGQVEVIPGGYDYFLEKFGWDGDENTVSMPKEAPIEKPAVEKEVINKKELRKKEAEKRQALNKKIKPIQDKITKLEGEIEQLEKQIQETNDTLIKASQNNDVDQFVILSKQIKTDQKAVDKHYKTLEKLTQQYDDLMKESEL